MEIKRQRVIAEFVNGDVVVMFADGDAQVFTNAEQAFHRIQARCKAQMKAQHIDGLITEIDWRNTPVGFIGVETVEV